MYTKEQKEMFEQALKVLAHAAVQENKAGGKNAGMFTKTYFEFRNFVYSL